jgi:hypothetical protein
LPTSPSLQKISGRLRSEQATQHRYAIRGYLSTAAKHRINTLAALRGALEGNPRPQFPTLRNRARTVTMHNPAGQG